jgi:hypothetical protein
VSTLRKEYLIQDTPEYLAKMIVENFRGTEVPFLHLDFKKWSPTAFKSLLKAWRLFRETVRGTFFAIPNHDEIAKWEKFVKRLGFEEFRPITCPDGKARPCYWSQDTYG